MNVTAVVAREQERRLELARELGATHAVDASRQDPVEAIRGIAGADFTLEASGSPAAVRAAVDTLAPMGACASVGEPALGAEATFDVNHVFTGGRRILGVVEGESVLSQLRPTLVELWRRGPFPVDRMMTTYDFDEIDRAAHDAEGGAVAKPVLRMA